MTVRLRLLASSLLAVAGVFMLVVGLVLASGNEPREQPTVVEAIEEHPGLAADSGTEQGVVATEEVVGSPNANVAGPPIVAALPQGLEVVPTRVRIPSIEVDASVVDLGLNPDRTLEVPKDISVTGWYTGRAVPGEIGPGVVVGHVDSAVAGAGVFFRLRDLVAGDTIDVERSDGSIATFRVTKTATVSKDEFPTEQVYGSTALPTLRLITCGGGFDRSARSYLNNVIVYAEFLGTREPPVSRS